MSKSLNKIEEEILYNQNTRRYTIFRPRTGETRQTSYTAANDMERLGVVVQEFKTRKDVEAYIKSVKTIVSIGTIHELGKPITQEDKHDQKV